MSRARAAVLDAVEAGDGSSSLADLSTVTGLHANTLRDHLEALTAVGLVRREQATPHGRGRPAWLYGPTTREAAPVAEYAGLAATLAATLQRTSVDPVTDAVAAGTEWGHDLARNAGRPDEQGDLAARRQVVTVLDRMGFDPQVETENEGHTDAERSTVRLTRCPLLDAARRYPDVVCGVHLGIAKGALREYDADDSQVSLVPFAEPDACLLHLGSLLADR
jgi:predicted ArsR family transcriptional regulator